MFHNLTIHEITEVVSLLRKAGFKDLIKIFDGLDPLVKEGLAIMLKDSMDEETWKAVKHARGIR
jgi:hypothetical protein